MTEESGDLECSTGFHPSADPDKLASFEIATSRSMQTEGELPPDGVSAGVSRLGLHQIRLLESIHVSSITSAVNRIGRE